MSGATWQVTPHELRSAGLDRALRAVVCAPSLPTNLHSRRTIDYLLISEELVRDGWEAGVLHGCDLAVRVPATVSLPARRKRPLERRIAQPRILPHCRPHGPTAAPRGVDWDAWQAIDKMANETNIQETTIEEATVSWYAGAESELK